MKKNKNSFLFEVIFKERLDAFWLQEDLLEMSPDSESEFLEDSMILKIKGTNLLANEISLVLDYYNAQHRQLANRE